MQLFKWFSISAFLCLPVVLLSQDYSYDNNSWRFGLGYGTPIQDSFEQNDLKEVVLYVGYQLRRKDGKLRIIPAIDGSLYRLYAGPSSYLDLVGYTATLSVDYDLFRGKRSSFVVGLGAGLQSKRLLLSPCAVNEACEYIELGSDSGGTFSMNLGYRYEKEESKTAFEVYTRMFNGDVGRWMQVIFLIDLKVK